jgi:alpha-D-xyloside xylohydrolase
MLSSQPEHGLNPFTGPYGTGNSSFGNFDFDPVFYPTPKQFISNISAAGFDFQVWVANRAFLNTELYNTSVANEWLFSGISPIQFQGPALNLSIPAAYDYFKTHLKIFTDLGVKGFKIDRGEEGEMPDYEQNIQMSLFEKLCHEVLVEAWGTSNFYSFARSTVDRARSFNGVWNGDSHSNFTGLQYTVTSGIRAGLLGFSMWGSDTGGYIRGTNDPTEELWARWMWFSAFSPVFEIMVGTGHTPWYAPYTSRLVSILKTTANLHVSLIPYIRSYTYQATRTGIPLVRALWLEYPEKLDDVLNIKNQYMFGEEFLVAPIVTTGNSRSIYFPGDNKWLNYLSRTGTPKVYQGGQTVSNITATIEDMPIYVKEGAIIPTGDLHQSNAKWDINWQPYLNFELFPSFDVSSSSFNYYSRETNKTVKIEMSVSGQPGSGNVTITNGDFGGLEKVWNATSIGEFWVYVAGIVLKVPIVSSGGPSSMVMAKSIWD